MTKEELTSVYYIKKEIKMWEEQLELIESKAEGKAMQITGLPFTQGTGSSDQMADLAIKAVSVRELIEAKKRKLNQQQDRIISWIISIDDTVVRQIMLYRHVRCYSWNTVAQKIGITADSARKQHDRYLQQSQKENK